MGNLTRRKLFLNNSSVPLVLGRSTLKACTLICLLSILCFVVTGGCDKASKSARHVNITGSVTHLAGSIGGSGSTDATGPAARFHDPTGITTDGTNLYVADTDNHTIRKIVLATGSVTTLAGKAGECGAADGTGEAARFFYPAGITTDGINLYVADYGNGTIRKIIIATGAVSTLAGNPGKQGVGDNARDGVGAAVRFSSLGGLTTDGDNLYIADSKDATIRKLDLKTGAVTTLAGKSGCIDTADGTGTTLRFAAPKGLVKVGDNLYVADPGNHTIRKIVISTGVVSILAGKYNKYGATDGIGTAARFKNPTWLTSDSANLYVSDSGNQTIRMIVLATGVVSTIAGKVGIWSSSDGLGSSARFQGPSGITIAGSDLYIADSGNHTIRKVIVATGEVVTMAGKANNYGVDDGTGSAARFFLPMGITMVGANLYVTDTKNHTIRRIGITSGEVSTMAGKAGDPGAVDGKGTAARFDLPWGITSDGTDLYIADNKNHTIRKLVIATREVTTLAGMPGVSGRTDGTGAMARFNSPKGITTDGKNLYVADAKNNIIRKIVIASGVVTSLAGRVSNSGGTGDNRSEVYFRNPWGIATDGTNIYVVDYNYCGSIKKFDLATNVVTSIAKCDENALRAGLDQHPAKCTTAVMTSFLHPEGITTDGANLYVTDSGTHSILKIGMDTGVITPLTGAGKIEQCGCNDGSLIDARFCIPGGLVIDKEGTNLYVADTHNHSIRKVHLNTTRAKSS